MTLAEHLIELRKRLLWSAAALVVGAIVGYFIWQQIFDLMVAPYCRLPNDISRPLGGVQCRLNSSNPLGEFGIKLKVALIGGVIISAPVWLYQLWAFIAPGLHRKERRWGLAFISVSFLLFSGGLVFAYFTLDKGLEFLLTAGGTGIVNVLDVNDYFGFITLMLLAFGFSFEFPLVLVLLNMAGIVTTARMRSSRRTVAFLIAVFAAVITPTQDPITFAAMAVPMYVFYESAILFGRVRDRARRRRALEDPNSLLGDDETSVIDTRPSVIDTRPSVIDTRPSNLDDVDE